MEQGTAHMTMESEEQLVQRAQAALSSCNWVIGECAARWTERYAKGRTDHDFGALIGLSGDQVYQRRRVWETFADVHEQYTSLKWSHFYVALNWDDAAECLQWAEDMQATLAEMRAWRKAQHGEDLEQRTPADDDPPFSPNGELLSYATAAVRDPDEFGREPRPAGSSALDLMDEPSERPVTATSAARESNLPEYAPFGKGARGSAPGETKERAEPTFEEIFKKSCAAIERVVAALTPEAIEAFAEQPIAIQQRFLDAVENLQARVAGLN